MISPKWKERLEQIVLYVPSLILTIVMIIVFILLVKA